ncbi:MAG: acyl-CoA dehydrogenase family protein [Deltaproteobacteria bacterium]|nr:acyl-CoA dehydrogenase family protein [Deltaproteobacteria bacterium]
MEKEPVSGICAEDIMHYQDLARQYAKKSLLPIFQGEYSDGNLSLLPEKLKTAFEAGIAATPDTSLPGCQYGIWGGATDEQGMMPSLLLLSTIAETCGGVAMCLHAQGVASNLLLQAKKALPQTPVRAGLCLQEEFCPPFLGTIMSPAKDAPAQITTTAVQKNNKYIINGSKSFVYSMNDVDAYVVLARVNDKWGCFLVGAKEKGIERTDVGVRTGLRACLVEHVDFNNVEIPLEARIDDGDARELVIRAFNLHWTGMAAIAVGIAKGAAAAARKYAAERYQGGTQIEEHPAIKMLIAGSESAIAAAEAAVASIQDGNLSSLKNLKKSASTKLTVMELCSRAVTDCLQSFGGYGYMEDFGMEKRLRDVTVLKSASGSSTYLKQLIFDIEKEGAL